MAYGMEATNHPGTYEHWHNARHWVGGLAVDGNIDPNIEHDHCSHPWNDNRDPDPPPDTYASWVVSFNQSVVIYNVTVYNRNTGM